MIGNSFHVGVMKHIFRSWIVLLKEFDSTLGYPGEGPTWEERRRRLLRCAAIDGIVIALVTLVIFLLSYLSARLFIA